MKETLLPRATMCATCPFRDGSPYEFLRDDLTRSALSTATRICHSTGSRNAVNSRPKGKARACRGARDMQLKFFAAVGVIPEATDEAWASTWARLKAGCSGSPALVGMSALK